MNQRMKAILVKTLKTFVPLAFGVFIFWLIFRKLDFVEMMNVLKSGVRFDIIMYSLPFCLFANIIRAYRWNLLITPLGFQPKKSNLVYAVLGNYGVNLVFPRLGEVWRCSMITRYEGIPFTKLLGTLIIDRLADTITVMIIILIALIMNLSYFKNFFIAHPEYAEAIVGIGSSYWTYLILLFVIIVAIIAFKFYSHTTPIKKVKSLSLNVWEGIHTVVDMKERRRFLLYTILIWFGYFLFFYICFYAFDFTRDLGWKNGLIAFGMSSVAVAVPVQGGIGPWHAAVIATLMGFGISHTNASAFAICVHTVQQLIFTAIVGLIGVMALPIVNRKK